MKISTRGRYALRLMVDLAVNGEEKCIPLREIADRQQVSDKYLEQIITKLSKAGLVKSVRGAQGGYVLTRSPQQYTVGMILRQTEGSLVPVSCVDHPQAGHCSQEEVCVTQEVWRKIGEAVSDVVDHITLAELAEKKKKILEMQGLKQ